MKPIERVGVCVYVYVCMRTLFHVYHVCMRVYVQTAFLDLEVRMSAHQPCMYPRMCVYACMCA